MQHVMNFQGFGDRLLSEIKKLSPKDVQIKVSFFCVTFKGISKKQYFVTFVYFILSLEILLL